MSSFDIFNKKTFNEIKGKYQDEVVIITVTLMDTLLTFHIDPIQAFNKQNRPRPVTQKQRQVLNFVCCQWSPLHIADVPFSMQYGKIEGRCVATGCNST